ALGQAADRERRFFIQIVGGSPEDERDYVAVTGTLAGEGDRVRVYVDRETGPTETAPSLIDEIIALLDQDIIPHSRVVVGEHADVDGDGKLAVLVTGWLRRLSDGATPVNGYVRSNDFHPSIDVPFGNRADVLYLSTGAPTGPALKALLAHEYTH